MEISDIVVIVSVIAMDIYGFYMIRKVDREVDRFSVMRENLEKTLSGEISEIKTTINDILAATQEKIDVGFNSLMETKDIVDVTILEAKEIMSPAVIVEMAEAVIMNSLQTLAMQNLKDLGKKGAVVKNAKIGLQVVGNEVAKGAGVNELLEKFAPVAEKLEQGGGLMEAFSDNPLIQLAAQFMGGGGGNSQPKNITPQGNHPRELKK